jgi:hypothetical protein
MRLSSRSVVLASLIAVGATGLVGCGGGDTGKGESDITDVPQTPVERQAIGNCWLYAQASWVESMHLAATGDELDISQSYWTYWHWYGEILDGYGDEIATGGNQWTANAIAAERGLMNEADFVGEDTTSEMSSRQSSALNAVNLELKEGGRLASSSARNDPATVRQVLDEAWQLSDEVKGLLDQVFGSDGRQTIDDGASVEGTSIIAADDLEVAYTERKTDPDAPTLKATNLSVAMKEWRDASYPNSGSNLASKRRQFQIRVQKALHDRQPVVVTWNVDFNAMESRMNDLRGSFNMTTLDELGPGRQGGHMTVMEDYQADTEEFGTLAAGVTLDPENEEDAAKLEAALLPSTTLSFIRIKNSWGGFRDDRASAPGFPGYHDLYLDYLNGPLQWCPDVTATKTDSNCTGRQPGLRTVALPPGY